MKILVCTNHSYMYWRFRRELTQALLGLGEVVLSTPFEGHQEDLAALGCRMVETPVDRRGIRPDVDWKLIRFYWDLLRREKPDLVLTYSIKPNVYAGTLCRMLGIEYCVHVQGLGTAFQKPGLAKIATILYKTAVKKAKTTFFENESNAEEFRRLGIQTAERQTVLPGAGINLSQYPCRSYPDHDKIHFLYLGRLMTEKGVAELLYAAQKLREAGVEFVLDLVGFYEDEYKAQVEALVEQGIAVFHGFQSVPQPYYAATDCVVLPSYHEGMSNVLLEAAATGRPVITSDIPGCREAVLPEVSGFLVPVRSGEALYEAMKRMAQCSPAQRAQMGKAGRAWIEQTFDKTRVVRQTLAALLDKTPVESSLW